MSFMEDDDDDFGDLYSDVLRPFTNPSTISSTTPSQSLISLSTPPSNPPPQSNLNNPHIDDDEIFHAASDPNVSSRSEILVSNLQQPSLLGLSIDSAAAPSPTDGNMVEEESGIRFSPELEMEEVSSGIGRDVKIEEQNFLDKEKIEDVELDENLIIPGLSTSLPPHISDSFRVSENKKEEKQEESNRGSKREDNWEYSDSDSEDDLQIVLNSEPPGIMGGNEDGEYEDLIISTDGVPHQPIEEQDLGEDLAKPADGERKETGEAATANELIIGNSVGPRPIYNNLGFHPQHSQFKYVRPSAAPVPGGPGPGGVQSQVRPPVNGPLVGVGRGDWRPVGMNTAPAMHKNFQPGFNGFGRGLDFTLPSHKTVFEVDIDSFEEKPWRHAGVDVSDFFNFGFIEDPWKEYCKQLGQLRLEATMQSKIRVYESGRSMQNYDPDLPPELAAAAGVHDFTAENPHMKKTDSGQGDLTGEGRATVNARTIIPTGRTIPVEVGYGERLPSIDTRQARMRDSDAIIEIVLQDSMDDDSCADNDTHEQLDNELRGEDDVKEENGMEEVMEQADRESLNCSPYDDGLKKKMMGRGHLMAGCAPYNIREGDGILPFPADVPLHYHPGSKGRSPNPGGILGAPHEGRPRQGTVHDRYPRLNTEDGIINNRGASINGSDDSNKEKSGRTPGGSRTPGSTSSIQINASRIRIAEKKDDMQGELAKEDSSGRVNVDEMGRDVITTSNNSVDGGSSRSLKNNLISPVEQDIDEGYELRVTQSSDNSRARSESSRDYHKKRDGGEEVMQKEHVRPLGDVTRRRDEVEHSFRKRGNSDRDGRQESDRNQMVVKRREDSYYSHRDSEPSPAHHQRSKATDFEMRREINPIATRQRRDGDTNGMRVNDEGPRRRERVGDIISRHGGKVRESESIERDEHHHSRKRLENSEWTRRHEKVVPYSEREKDDISNSHEILNNFPMKRRKDDEHRRREVVDEEEYLHGIRNREGNGRKKQDTDNYMEEQRRDERPRMREKPDNQNLIRHREESWRSKERDDWQRLKQPQEDTFSNRDREEGKRAAKNPRRQEDEPYMGNGRVKDESRGLNYEKEHQSRDKKHRNEQPKKKEKEEVGTPSHNRGHNNVCTVETYTNNEDKNPRHERLSKNSDHYVNNRQLSEKERTKEKPRSKESDVGDQTTVTRSKRKHEESAHQSVKVSPKGDREQASGNILASGPTDYRLPGHSRTLSASSPPSKKTRQEHEIPLQDQHLRNHREDASSDDERRNSRRRQPKQEMVMNDKAKSRTNTKTKDDSKNNNRPSLTTAQPDDSGKKVEAVDNQIQRNSADKKASGDTDVPRSLASRKDLDLGKTREDRDHLDTVARLKKRSERFKLPMPSEKETAAPGNEKINNEAVIAQSETPTDAAEIKPERPARKRRWISG